MLSHVKVLGFAVALAIFSTGAVTAAKSDVSVDAEMQLVRALSQAGCTPEEMAALIVASESESAEMLPCSDVACVQAGFNKMVEWVVANPKETAAVTTVVGVVLFLAKKYGPMVCENCKILVGSVVEKLGFCKSKGKGKKVKTVVTGQQGSDNDAGATSGDEAGKKID